MSHRINANITHAMYYAAAITGGENALDELMKKSFGDVVKYLSKQEEEELLKKQGGTEKIITDPYMKDMQVVEDFLRGGGQNCKTVRYFLRDFCPDLEKSGLAGWCVMLTYFPETHIIALSFHYSLKDTNEDILISLKQSGTWKKHVFPDETNRWKKTVEKGQPDSNCIAIARVVSKALGLGDSIDGSYLCEITKFGDYTDIDSIRENEAKLLYGLLSGDEGYEFVPEALVEERLVNFWGSRSFTRIYACHQSGLFLNLLNSPEVTEYLERQTQFGTDIYGGANPYFFIGECPMAVNHGIMFSLEFVMMLKALIKNVLAFHTHYNNKKHVFSYPRRIRETRELRRKIITVLEKVESTPISEMGELSGMLLKSQNIAPVVNQVKYLLELLEGDLSLAYSEYNNALITLLTIGGLILSAIPYVPDIMEFFKKLF